MAPDESQLSPNTFIRGTPPFVNSEMRCTAIGRPGARPRPSTIENLPVLDRETGRRRIEFDPEVLGECGLIIGVIRTPASTHEGCIDPVQPPLIAGFDRERVRLWPPRSRSQALYLSGDCVVMYWAVERSMTAASTPESSARTALATSRKRHFRIGYAGLD